MNRIMKTTDTFTRAALVADALSLGSHWVYNQSKLTRTFPEGIYDLTDPLAQYHKGKTAGDFTHYGDQTLWLYTFIQKNKGYSAEQWKEDWVSNMTNYSGYKDSASNETLSGKQSGSNDLAGASRIGPLLDLGLPVDDAVVAARSQTVMTHGDVGVSDAAEYFVRAVYAIKGGSSFGEAFSEAIETGSYAELDVEGALVAARGADAEGHLKVATEMGITCHLPEAFPLALYYAFHHGDNFADCISMNNLAGGDNSARGMLLALLFVARDGDVGGSHFDNLNLSSASPSANLEEDLDLSPGSHHVQVAGPNGVLSGIIEVPELREGQVLTTAVFAHCFTCGKDFLPEKKVTTALAGHGIATLRIDFSGLGKSAGAFEDSSFLTNLEDIYAAADWLRSNLCAPSLLVGHSLGGAAVLAAASNMEEIQAVATIGAPADPAHVLHLIGDVTEIEKNGKAEVSLGGRKFTVSKRFLDDIRDYDYVANLNALAGHKLIMHSPTDGVVELKNAGEIYSNLQHPKSFMALADAHHLLTNPGDAEYVAQLISVWADKVITK